MRSRIRHANSWDEVDAQRARPLGSSKNFKEGSHGRNHG
jgi:hypothetical protein